MMESITVTGSSDEPRISSAFNIGGVLPYNDTNASSLRDETK